MRSFATHCVLAAVIACQVGRAQGHVWVVSSTPIPGKDFSKISDAINAAADGDVILVQWAPFTYDKYQEDLVIQGKSLTLQSREPPHVVDVLGSLRVSGLSAAQSVLLRGFRFSSEGTGAGGAKVHFHDNAGAVWFEGYAYGTYSLQPGNPGQVAALVERCASVVFAGGVLAGGKGYPGYVAPPFYSGPLTGGGVALHASHSMVFVHDTLVAGGECGFVPDPFISGWYHYGPSGTGVWTEGGSLFLDGSNVKPGLGTTDCSSATAPACGVGIFLGSGAPQVSLFDTLLAGNPPTYVQSGGVQSAAGKSRSIDSSSPVREGDSGTISFTGLPGDLAYLGVSPEPGQLALPPWTGTILLGSPIALFPLGQVSGSGSISIQTQVPELGPGVAFQRWLLQGAALDAAGFVVLSEPTAVLLLDSAF